MVGLTAPTIASDGVARGLQRFQPRRLVLAPVGAENRNSNAGHRVLLDSPCMQGSANDQLSKHPGGGEQGEPWSQHLSVGGGGHLDLAVDVTTSGFNINTVGVILMAAGALGLVLSLLFWSSFAPYRRDRTVAGPDTVVEERRIERDLP